MLNLEAGLALSRSHAYSQMGVDTAQPLSKTVIPLPSPDTISAIPKDKNLKNEHNSEVVSILDTLPLKHLPLPAHRKTNPVMGETIFKAKHELAHAWQAMFEGKVVYGIQLFASIDGSLARTFISDVTPTIAAASANVGDWGTASDQSVVKYGFNQSWSSAVNATSNAWSHIAGIIDIAGEITAYLGSTIPGNKIGEIFARAQAEKDLMDQYDGKIPDYIVISDEQKIEDSQKLWDEAVDQAKTLPTHYIERSLFPNGDVIVKHVIDNKVVETYRICGICGSTNGVCIKALHDIREQWDQPPQMEKNIRDARELISKFPRPTRLEKPYERKSIQKSGAIIFSG
jgi:hypothetical protein